jgi:hypothetical protein
MATAKRISKKANPLAIEPTETDIPERIRARAYQLFEERGGELGHDLEDWLEAEAEILGNRKPSAA